MTVSKRYFIAFIAFIMVAANFFIFANNTKAEDMIVKVYVDSQPVSFGDTQAQMIRGITMVPFRALGETLGAEVKWDDAKKQVTIIKESKYAALAVGNKKMTHGSYGKDLMGNLEPKTQEFTDLAMAPEIVGNRVLVPLVAISVALDATYDWQPDTKSVYVFTKKAPAQNTTPAAPTATKTPAPDPYFGDTAYFQEVSGKRVEDMHLGKMKFAVTIYDSKEEKSKQAVLMIKRAAEQAKLKVYGFDKSGTKYPNPQNLQWVWNIVDKNSTDYPQIIISYEGEKDLLLPSGVSQDEIVAKLENLKLDYPLFQTATTSPTASPTASASASPSPTPTSTSTSNSDVSYSELKLEDSMEKYNKNESFIYIVYDTTNSKDFSADIDVVKTAAKEIGVSLYYINLKDESSNFDWFGKNEIQPMTTYPLTFTVVKGAVYEVSGAYSSPSSYHSAFKYFKDNK